MAELLVLGDVPGATYILGLYHQKDKMGHVLSCALQLGGAQGLHMPRRGQPCRKPLQKTQFGSLVMDTPGARDCIPLSWRPWCLERVGAAQGLWWPRRG